MTLAFSQLIKPKQSYSLSGAVLIPTMSWFQLLLTSLVFGAQVPSLNPAEFFSKLKDTRILRGSISSNVIGNHETLSRKVFIKSNVKYLKMSDLSPVRPQYVTGEQPELIRTEIACLERLRGNPYFPEIIAQISIAQAHFAILAFEPSFDLRIIQNPASHSIIRPHAAFFIAQILTALEYLHSLGILYVDLKDENVLIDSDGLVKLIDFGACGTPLEVRDSGFNSFCSPLYAAPEVLERIRNDDLRSCASDWWSFGILSYMIITGLTPFYAEVMDDLWDLLRDQAHYPFSNIENGDARSLIAMFLKYNPAERAGFHSNNLDVVKRAAFFAGVDWQMFASRNIKCPITLPDKYYRK